jgi:uncharacterized protein with HEPN domain
MPIDPRDATRLDDILIYARRAQQYVGHLTAAELKADDMSQDAVARCFAVIGEAARQLTPACKDAHAAVPWPMIVSMGHRIIHEYSQVDYELVLKTVRDHLPALFHQVEAILAGHSPPLTI